MESVAALLSGTGSPVLHLPGYVAPGLAAAWASAVEGLPWVPLEVTVDDPGGVTMVCGLSLLNSISSQDGDVDYSPYFDQVAHSREAVARAMAEHGLPHPVDDVLVPLIAGMSSGPVSVAAEPDGRQYYAGVLRLVGEGLHHHADTSSLMVPDLVIGTLVGQGSALIYLDTPTDGSGALRVFHRRATLEDYTLHGHPAYGFKESSVAGADSTTVVPEAGDVVLFDAWSIHVVEPSTPGVRRLTISTFFGLMPDGSVILWS